MLTRLYRYSRARLRNLPTEIKTLILYFMAAQDVHQFRAIRLCSKSFEKTISIHQDSIVWAALNSKKSIYRTASVLRRRRYRAASIFGLSPLQPVIPDLQHLFGMARRCDIARQLASSLASLFQTTQFSFKGTRLSEASRARFIRNLEPYALALAHFFECYRNGLAHYEPVTRQYSWSNEVQLSILSDIYKKETVFRICALYSVLTSILDNKVHHLISEPRFSARTMLDWEVKYYSGCIEIFTFGGLEAVTALLMETDKRRYLNIIEKHFARAFPFLSLTNLTVSLPASTLPTISYVSTRRVYSRLPHNKPQLPLDFDYLRTRGYPEGMCSKDQEIDRFYQHLLTYEGNAPDLLR